MSDESNDDPNRHMSSTDKKGSRESNTSGAGSRQTKSNSTTAWNTNAPVFTPQGAMDRSGGQAVGGSGAPGHHGPMHHVDPNYYHHPNYPYGHHPHGMMHPGHQHQQVPPRIHGVPPPPQFIPFDPERHCSNIHPSWYGMRNGQKVFLGPTQRMFQVHGPAQHGSHQNNPHQIRTQNDANNQHNPNGPPISKTQNKDNHHPQPQQQPNNHPTSMATNAVPSEAQGNNTKQPVSYNNYQQQQPQPTHATSGTNKSSQQQHTNDNFQGGHQHHMPSFGAQYSSDVRRSHPHMQNNYQEGGYGQHLGSNAPRNNTSCNHPVQYYQETHKSSHQSQKAAGDFHQDHNQHPLISGGGNSQHSGNQHFAQNNTMHHPPTYQSVRAESFEPRLHNSGRLDGYSAHNNLQHNQNQQYVPHYSQHVGAQVQENMTSSKILPTNQNYFPSGPPLCDQLPQGQVQQHDGGSYSPSDIQSIPPLLPDPSTRLAKGPLVPNPFYIGPPHEYIGRQSVPSSGPNILQHRAMHQSPLPISAGNDRQDLMNNDNNSPMQLPRKEIVPVFHAIHAMGQYIQSLHVINAQHAHANSYLNAQLKEYVDRETQLLHTLENIPKLSSIVEETEPQLSSPTELLTPKSLTSPRSGEGKSGVEGLPKQEESETKETTKLENEEKNKFLENPKDECDSLVSALKTMKLDQSASAQVENANVLADKVEVVFLKEETKSAGTKYEIEKVIELPPTETNPVAAQKTVPTSKNNNSVSKKSQKQLINTAASRPVERRSDIKPYLPPASRGKADQPISQKSQKQKAQISTDRGLAKPEKAPVNKKNTHLPAVVSSLILSDGIIQDAKLDSDNFKKVTDTVGDVPAKGTNDKNVPKRRHAPLSLSLSLPAQSAYKFPLAARSRSIECDKLFSPENKSEKTKNDSKSQTRKTKIIVSSATPPAGNYKKTCNNSQRSNEKSADVLSNRASNVSHSPHVEEKPPVITKIIVPTAKEAVEKTNELPSANPNSENISKKAQASNKSDKSKPKKRFSRKHFSSKNSQHKTSLEEEKEQIKELKKLELLQKAEKKERLQCITTVRKFTKSYYNDMHRARCTYLAFWKPRPLMPEIQSEIIHFWGDRMPGAFSHSEKLEEMVLTFVNNRIRTYKGSANMDIYKMFIFFLEIRSLMKVMPSFAVVMDDFLWQIDKKLTEYHQLELDRHYYEMVSTFPDWKPRNVPSDCCKYEDFLQPPVRINEHPLRCFIAHLNLQNCMINNLHFDPDLITDLDDHVGQMFDELTDVPVDWTPAKTKVFFRAKIAVLNAKQNKSMLERDYLQFYNFLLHVKSHVLDFDVFWYHLSCTTKKREGEEWLLTSDLMFFRLLFGDEDKWHR